MTFPPLPLPPGVVINAGKVAKAWGTGGMVSIHGQAWGIVVG